MQHIYFTSSLPLQRDSASRVATAKLRQSLHMMSLYRWWCKIETRDSLVSNVHKRILQSNTTTKAESEYQRSYNSKLVTARASLTLQAQHGLENNSYHRNRSGHKIDWCVFVWVDVAVVHGWNMFGKDHNWILVLDVYIPMSWRTSDLQDKIVRDWHVEYEIKV